MDETDLSDEQWLSLNYPKTVFDDPVIKQMFCAQLRKLDKFELAMRKKNDIDFKPYRYISRQ